ncbi:serine hydrolase domain-containing protein [Serratia proteamaculans]|uniref:Serine hydrolase n=1 Tax=Serratia proteamaculans TaxID=28151 RepID=A0A5Q2VF71_SERPR|nr:serine hydrolase [Serratia proteamaculans]QGH62033.1 serine hydrolase [Serratia proteamaculans]
MSKDLNKYIFFAFQFLFLFSILIPQSIATNSDMQSFSDPEGLEERKIPGLRHYHKIEKDPENILELNEVHLDINIPKINFTVNGRKDRVDKYLFKTGTRSVIVLHDKDVVYEKYSMLNNRETLYTGWSLTKMFLNAAIGSLIYNTIIDSENEPIDRYALQLSNSAYSKVTIQQALQQSSAVKENEYLNMPGLIFYLNKPGNGWESYLLTKSRMSGYQPGEAFNYTETDPAALALMLREASGYSLSEYIQERIWKPIGMEYDGRYQLDNQGKESGGNGLEATLRDYARMGLLYANYGSLNGSQVFTAEWVKKSIEPTYYPKGKLIFNGTKNIGYGYFWWPSLDGEGDFFIPGLFGNFIYIDPRTKVVIVRIGIYQPIFYHGRPYIESVLDVSRAIRDEIMRKAAVQK